jgi:hypothetical protein
LSSRIIKFIGSVYFAIALILVLAVLLILSTSLESLYGTPFAQRIFYRAGWFDIFLCLLALNIFTSAALRYPYKKRHTGFVITHTGILILLAGSLISRLLGVEGQLTLVETEHGNQIVQEGYQVALNLPEGKRSLFPIKPFSGKKPIQLKVKDTDIEVVVHEVTPHAVPFFSVREGEDDASPNQAIRFTLQSQRANVKESLWLIQKDPLNPHSSFLQMGPANFWLKSQDSDKTTGPSLRITRGPRSQTLQLDEDNKLPFSIFEGDLQLNKLQYYPHARVQDDRLTNDTQKPFNPACELTVSDKEGREEHHTKFALFPQGQSLHGGQKNNLFDLEIGVLLPTAISESKIKGPLLTFFTTADGAWHYRSRSKEEILEEGPVSLGKETPTGWMDMSFTVQETFRKALTTTSVRTAPKSSSGVFAALVSTRTHALPLERHWIWPDHSVKFQTPAGEIETSLTLKTYKLPFGLLLKDFRKVDYPGTQNAASFESDVVLVDREENTWIQKTISMNKPMDYAGFRIFQSSYFQDPAWGDGSVFTVAKNPGIPLIYTGACIILLGVLTLFYIPSLSRESLKKQ